MRERRAARTVRHGGGGRDTGALTAGQAAETIVHQRIRDALPADYRVWPNVHWIARTASHHGLRDGEADLVIAHPERGILVVETKAGEIARDGYDRWFAGKNLLKVTPFRQAETNLHALIDKLRELPAAPPDFRPIAGHAVALPDVDLASMGGQLRLLGPDVMPELILDRATLDEADPQATRRAIDRALELWAGDSADKRAPGPAGIALLGSFLEAPIRIRSMLRGEIAEGGRHLVELTRHQHGILQSLQGNRRVHVTGAAGTGKTMLAAEKARQLAGEGYDTLLACFNQPLARLLTEITAEVAARTGRLTVSTFHQLCEDLAREAGVLPPKPPNPVPSEWFSETLPGALDDAVPKLGPRFHAIVIDEGQDFEAGWLLSLESLLHDPKQDVLYVFHDPAQALYRDEDVVESLGLMSYELDENVRNPGPVHDLAMRHARGAPATFPHRTDGREPEWITAEPGPPTVEALRVALHRLRHDEGVGVGDIAVLTGASLTDSAVWRQKVFGNEVLWNGQVDDAGLPTGRSATEVPEQPPDVILCDSIRRFKGLEKPVVVLVDLRPDDPRLERLLYVGASRPTQHLVVIAPPGIAR